MDAQLEALLDLDRLTHAIRLATLHGEDLAAGVLYGEFLNVLQAVAEHLGLDPDDVMDAISAA